MANRLMRGLVAGAVGTTALNMVTYLDMVLRGRPASSTPDETVRKAAEFTGLSLAVDGPASDTAANRRSGLGALLGIAAGLGTGAVYGLLRHRLPHIPVALLGVGAGVAANIGTTGPMAAFGITDPRDWKADSWVSDLLPHLAYGFAAATTFDMVDSHKSF